MDSTGMWPSAMNLPQNGVFVIVSQIDDTGSSW